MNGRRLVTIGHGYSAGFLTRRLVPEGWTVTGTTRDGAAKVAAAGAVSAAFGVSAQTLWRWRRDYAGAGVAGLRQAMRLEELGHVAGQARQGAGLRHLVWATRGGFIAVAMLLAFHILLFSGVQFGIAVMRMAQGRDSGPRGLRRPLGAVTRTVRAPSRTST